jgi:hypothetical protein
MLKALASDNAPTARSFDRHLASLELLGTDITKLSTYGVIASLAVIYFWFGGMKFTAYEAEGLVPLVENSPLVSWMYDIFSVRGFSTFLGLVELTIGLLIAGRIFSPALSALGGLLSAGLFTTTVSFMISTPGAIGELHDLDPRRDRAEPGLPGDLGRARPVPAQGHRPAGGFGLHPRPLAVGDGAEAGGPQRTQLSPDLFKQSTLAPDHRASVDTHQRALRDGLLLSHPS